MRLISWTIRRSSRSRCRGGLAGGVALEHDPEADDEVRGVEGPHDDVFGHGAACAGIIRRVAPEAALYSVRVLGGNLRARGTVFAAGSEYAAVFSVAAHEGKDPFRFDYNLQLPVEFGAPGIDVKVAWPGGRAIETSGNSFAAAHLTGLVARVLSKHAELTPFQMKTILHALADNASVEPIEMVE